MYVSPDFKTKKELKQALADGRDVQVYQPAYGSVPTNGTVSLEGPHAPKPHIWYAIGTMVDGKLTKVR
jgi:hypothetical protein